MNKPYKKQLLKGGSLAGTYLFQETAWSPKVVRKEICLITDREYGYQRWYSQMKRIQRYEILFPGLFPSFLGCGIASSGTRAFFDMKFLENAENCYEYICSLSDPQEVEKVFNQVVKSMDKMHGIEMNSSLSSLPLYIEEEVRKKIEDCLVDKEFAEFYKHQSVVLNGRNIPSFSALAEDYISTSLEIYKRPTECFTHGNITLENMMYSPIEDRIYFIDPYDENIIDNVYNEYSQILQSCNSYYELYNASVPVKAENILRCEITIPFGISYFNELFSAYLRSRFDEEQMRMIKFFEVSQFIRMLPFKLKIDKEKMFLFYTIASQLTYEFLEELK